jgi:DNA mismatch endonuclease, patch repair protein
MGLRFRKHSRPVPHLRCEPDIVFPVQRVAVFVDGCWWHGCPTHWQRPASNESFWLEKVARNTARDRSNDQALIGAGWVVVRVWEHERIEDMANRVVEMVRRGGSTTPGS